MGRGAVSETTVCETALDIGEQFEPAPMALFGVKAKTGTDDTGWTHTNRFAWTNKSAKEYHPVPALGATNSHSQTSREERRRQR